MRTLISIFFIFIISMTNLSAQIDSQIVENSDSIEYFAKLLTGKWKLIGYYENDQFVEKEISTSLTNERTGIRISKTLTDTGLINKEYILDSLLSVDNFIGFEVIEMSFDKNGKGDYQHYSDYVVGRDWQIEDSSQPVPEIVYKNGKYLIELVSLAGEREKEFVVNTDTLILIEDNNYMKYKRIID